MQFHSLIVKGIRKETEGTVSVAFTIPKDLRPNFQFIPGQYITLKTIINGEDIRRAYSICSAPYENELRVAIKQIPNGKFSTFANHDLKIGDTIDVMTPNGHFHNDFSSSNEINYVAFAAGSGITPVLSILKHVLETEPKSTFSLFYGNKEVNSVIFGKEIDILKNIYPSRFSVHFIYSQENHGEELFYGRIDTNKLEQWQNGLFRISDTHEYFMCGPESMTNDIRSFLSSKNIDSTKVHFELFTTSSTPQAKKEISQVDSEKITSTVQVIIDDEEYEFELASDGDDILQAGIDADIDLPFSCKGGVCSTCRAKVLEGEATMKLNYSLLDEEVEAGYILTCQAHPKSEKLVVSFDD